MNKTDFNVIVNDNNQEPAKGIAFIKSRRAEANVMQIAREMNRTTIHNGVEIDTVCTDITSSLDYDRRAIGLFLEELKNHDYSVVVVRSLNDITDDIRDLEQFIKTITDMDLWLYSLEIGPIPITISHAEDFGC